MEQVAEPIYPTGRPSVAPDHDDAAADDDLAAPAEPGGGPAAVVSAVDARTIPIAFVDSSALVALVDRDDASHAAAVAAYRDLVGNGYRLFTTDYVVAETFDLLRAGLGLAIARQWLRDCRLAIYHVEEEDVANARRMVLGAPAASALSLTDAVSLVVMDRLGVTDAFAVDQRFLAALG